MVYAQSTPLGFFDLTRDEYYIISLFRQWNKLGPTRAIAEHRLASFLQRDHIYPALNSLFQLFNELQIETQESEWDSDILTEHEESLLELLCDCNNPDKDPLIKKCRDELQKLELQLRPASAIYRSGHEALLRRAAYSFQIAYSAI
ncbi:MAG: hypothetical protein AAF530_04505 [Pseudomonadota bacterium]